MSSRPPQAALVLALLLLALPAGAHPSDLLHLKVVASDDGQVHERLTLTAGTLALLAPRLEGGEDRLLTEEELARGAADVDAGVWAGLPLTAGGVACSRTSSTARLGPAYVELHATFECPEGPLRQELRLLSVLPAGHHALVETPEGRTLHLQGRRQTAWLSRSPEEATAGSGGEPGLRGTGWEGWVAWVRLGVLHIVTGWDHVLFLVALLLVAGGWARVLGLVTAFTLAHSVTLGLSALGLVVLSPETERWVEVVIAASIVFVAVENLAHREHRHRALVTFGFGLVHGFGFASVLAGYGVGEGGGLSAVQGLLGFNLGVELGQAALVGLLFPLVRLAQRRPRAWRWTVQGLSAAIVCMGAFWMVSRAVG